MDMAVGRLRLSVTMAPPASQPYMTRAITGRLTPAQRAFRREQSWRTAETERAHWHEVSALSHPPRM